MDEKMEQSGNFFLKDHLENEGISKIHDHYLGLKTPNDYFSKSKSEILSSIKEVEKEETSTILPLKNAYRWAIAASVAILIGASTFFWYHNTVTVDNIQITEIDKSNTDKLESVSDDVLISSLFIDDSAMDQYVDEYLVNTIFADVVYTDPDDVIINSLLMEDWEIDEYIDEYLIDEMIF